MKGPTDTLVHRLATFLINWRYGIVGIFVIVTAGMLYAMSNLQIETGFNKQLPLKHEYMQTFLQYEQEFGGPNRILVALVARDGDMFTPEFFGNFEEITNQVFFIPGVVALVWAGIDFFNESYAQNEHSSLAADGPPIYPFKAFIPIAGAVLLLQGVVEIIRCVICLKNGVWPAREEDVEEVDVDKLKAMVHVDDEDIAAADRALQAREQAGVKQ